MRGGRWVIRWYRGDGSYSQATLATADDIFPADGAEILDYAQAARRARDFVHEQRWNISAKVSGVFLTVRDAVEDYVAMRERREAAHEGQGGALKRDEIVPYALRHTSIVRGLRAGLPTRLVAALHDTSVPMIEKHYAAYVVDAMNDLATKATLRVALE